MTGTVLPLRIDDLPAVSAAEVRLRNADLAHFARRRFRCVDAVLRFSRALGDAPEFQRGDVWLALTFCGEPVLVRVSHNWANALAEAAGASLLELGADMLDLLCLSRLSPLLPIEVRYEGAAFSLEALGPEMAALPSFGTWVGAHARTTEISGHHFELRAHERFPAYAFFDAFNRHAEREEASPLADLRMSLPLVAARWTVDASDLIDLDLGDVLLIG